ncbi:Putative RNA polymerase I-specific transcription initiation factor Rrn5 [Septoria linicola]|uniref:RNA polymerase I-specific transcription initiation factor Rrn5 n=1 Tax=Septoria linicola TaxID=215465 RepID=A0A9Q9EJ04_9PEZI|nr:Putative RNA polymerase I-specific transcription initiation factor Rrn5 [Septoria linicola]
MAEDKSTDEYVSSDDASTSLDSDVEDSVTFDQDKGNKSRRNSQPDEQNTTTAKSVLGTLEGPSDAAGAGRSRSGGENTSRRSPSNVSPSTRSHAAQSRSVSRARSRSVDSVTSTAGVLTTEYRDLLNEMIEDARGETAAFDAKLGSSQIGASFWSAREKHALFQGIERYGEGDLTRLEAALHTKSQHEIQLYISVLRSSLVALPSSTTRSSIQLSDICAAAEIEADCVTALNAAADVLSSRVEKHEQLAERLQLKESWLIDANGAEQEEQEYEEALARAETAGETTVASKTDPDSSGHADLLRHATFLQLSRNLFMNHGEQDALNWHHVDPVTDVTDEPAMFRRAAADFHEIVVGLTRRLVQVSIFQALSRLRASDSSRADWTPLAAVRETDVRSAAELLNVSPDWKSYWARVARRCCIEVYSDSKKYNDGRPGTKSGYRLTHAELEAELDVEPARPVRPAEDDSTDILDDDVDEFLDDSDAFTDDPDAVDSDCNVRPEETRQNLTKPMSSDRRRKRDGTQRPGDYTAAQNQYLDALDSSASAREQVRLWETLRITPPAGVVDASQIRVVPQITQNKSIEHSTSHGWCVALGYEAEWESGIGQPQPEDFQAMDVAGNRGRKRRRLLEAKVRARVAPHPKVHLDETDDAMRSAAEDASSSNEGSVVT